MARRVAGKPGADDDKTVAAVANPCLHFCVDSVCYQSMGLAIADESAARAVVRQGDSPHQMPLAPSCTDRVASGPLSVRTQPG